MLIRMLSLFLLLLTSSVLAKNFDYKFSQSRVAKEMCVEEKAKGITNFLSSFLKGRNADGKKCKGTLESDVFVRFIDPKETDNAFAPFYIERPFLIIDGIYLGLDEKRTLDDLHAEVEQFGIPRILKTLGYTPVLVQFSETVRTSLLKNSENFREVLRILGKGLVFEFPGAKEEGIIVLGISQGGIIGRYGSYLYDIQRQPSDAPVTLYASLDSPHQGAVMPRGLFYALDFWAGKGSSDAEAFLDMINAPGASDLLLYNLNSKNVGNHSWDELSQAEKWYAVSPDTSRFLYGEYRKAANYKGFPSVLIAQGQLKGADPKHENVYYKLERVAKKLGINVGVATSSISYSAPYNDFFSYNRRREVTDESLLRVLGSTPYDFIQGSTYPFGRTLYNAFREGMLHEMPDGMTKDFGPFTFDIATKWNEDTLLQESSTFIPTTSAMDLQCNGDLAIRSNCAFTQSSVGFPFGKSGSWTTANATYAVDPTHPRYNEPISGRHVEMALKGDGSIDTLVLKGMQTDFWRLLCEVAKLDYDTKTGMFRNPELTGVISPTANCMDLNEMPDVIRNGGVVLSKNFAYARYDYNVSATEKDAIVKFELPAGWKKVATFDNGSEIPAGSVFEVNVDVELLKGNWIKAELLLVKSKTGNGQIQLREVDVPLDGKSHVIRWQMPTSEGALRGYRWMQLVLNSDGGSVILSQPRLLTNTRASAPVPTPIREQVIYPNVYRAFPWSQSTKANVYSDYQGQGLDLSFEKSHSGYYIDLGGMVSMDLYSALVVEYWPGTCQKTGMYFDSDETKMPNLANGSLQNGFVRKILLLDEIIDIQATPKFSKSAHRLNLQSFANNERCIIKSVTLE